MPSLSALSNVGPHMVHGLTGPSTSAAVVYDHILQMGLNIAGNICGKLMCASLQQQKKKTQKL